MASAHGMKQGKKRGQSWSTDVMIAAGLFILAFVVFFTILNFSSQSASQSDLISQGNIIPRQFIASSPVDIFTSPLVFIIDNQVDIDRLKNVSAIPYQQLKSDLGVVHDFCVYFEDQEGNLINLSYYTGESGIGLGSPNFTVSGGACGQT
ncbi:MAG: hypothetical protein ABIC95_05335 [archaeon]